MGVPGLWPFLKSKYAKKCYKIMTLVKKVNKFDYVYIDANGLLHGCTQNIFEYGNGKRLLGSRERKNETKEEKTMRVYEEFFELILDVKKCLNPSKKLFIALDGPAPRAKMNQQRGRRFVAAKNKPENFDPNSITPGTLFMYNLNSFIEQSILKSEDLEGIEIIFSPSSTPGEGEHKILDYIRNLPEKEKECNHCIFGPDGDLLLLSMLLNVKNISVMKEEHNNFGYYNLIDITSMKQNIYLDLSRDNRDRAIEDFVLMSFFLGNDFLPRFKMFSRLGYSYEMMIENYQKLGKAEYISYNSKNLYKLLKSIQRSEIGWLKFQSLQTPSFSEAKDDILCGCLTKKFSKKQNKDVKFLDFEKFRLDYYQSLDVFEKGDINKLCKDYFENVKWIHNYYVNGVNSKENFSNWGNFYPHHYPPLVFDMVNYVHENSIDATFEKDEPLLPFQQLLCVLPTESANLLPKKYQKIITDEDSELVKKGYYPKNFKVDYRGKFFEHEGIPILQFVDIEVMKKEYKKIDSKKPKRNLLTNYFFIFFSSSNIHRYKYEKSDESIKSKKGLLKSNSTKSLVIVKPDGVKRKLTKEIMGYFTNDNLKIIEQKSCNQEDSLYEKMKEHYSEHSKRDFYQDLCKEMSVGKIRLFILKGENAVEKCRVITEKLREKYALDFRNNTLHASDSYSAFEREYKIWF